MITFSQFINELQSKSWPIKRAGKDYQAKCPVHLGSDSSLIISEGDDGKILTNCMARKCPHEEIMKGFGHGKTKGKKNKKSEIPQGITLSELAGAKGFSVDFLAEMGCSNSTWTEKGWGKKIPIVKIDYLNGRYRARLGHKGKSSKWGGDKSNNIRCYKPKEFVGDKCFMVEGESDTWSLIHHGHNAIGVPGAQMCGSLYPDDIQGINAIYVIQENDEAGKHFAKNACDRLSEISYQGSVFVVDMATIKHNDLNEIHRRKPQQFNALVNIAINCAITPKFRFVEVGDEHVFRIYQDRIVYVEQKKNRNMEIIKEPKTIINQGVIVESVHRDVFSDECTVTLRWGKNKRKRFLADTLLFGKLHGELARHGILSDSNNSKYIVTYFNTVISNLIKEEKVSSRRNGWSGDRFVYGSKMFDEKEEIPVEFEAVDYTPETKGGKAKQVEAINYLVSDVQIALKCGAAAISPLIEKMKCENFTYHSWGDSGRGKTIGSKVGASLYANPSRILNSWEGTRAGIETIMEEAGGLPIFLEESHKGRPESVVQTVYSFANRKQAARAEMKDSKRSRRKSPMMRGVIVSTGEWQISALSADGGATARLLEQHKTRVSKEGYAESLEKYIAELEENYGHFGEKIIKRFMEKKEETIESFESYKAEIRKTADGGIQYRQIPYFAACLVGCDILRELGINVPSVEELKACCIQTMSFKPKSLYDKSIEFLMGCLDEYSNKFYLFGEDEKNGNRPISMQRDRIRGDVFGMHDETSNTLYIYSKVFTDLIKANNMSRNSVLQTLLENGSLETDNSSGKRVFTKKKRIDGKPKVTVAIRIPCEYLSTEEDEPEPEPEPEPEQPKTKKAPQAKTNNAPISLEKYIAMGYGYEIETEDKRGKLFVIFYTEDENIDRGWFEEEEIPQQAANIFEKHIAENNTADAWKKKNTVTVATKEMIEDSATSEQGLFELKQQQYDDDRGS